MKLNRVCAILRLKPKSVIRIRNRGDIKATVCIGGRYDYDDDSVMAYKERLALRAGSASNQVQARTREDWLYIRASRGTKENIENQKNRLMLGVKRFCDEKNFAYPTKWDRDYYSSDEGHRRRGFVRLCRHVFQRRVKTVYVISAPRLFRGARVFLEIVFAEFGTKLICLDELGKTLSELDKENADVRAAIALEVSREQRAANNQKIIDAVARRDEQIKKEIPEARKKLVEYKTSKNKVGYLRLGELIKLYDAGVKHKALVNEISKHVAAFDDF